LRVCSKGWLIAEPIGTDLQERVRRLVEIGLGYLTIERATPSLSAGEAQRLRADRRTLRPGRTNDRAARTRYSPAGHDAACPARPVTAGASSTKCWRCSTTAWRRSTGRTLYLLDEPATSLHPADTAHLVRLLQRLVDAGNTVIVVEHNLDVVKCADWVIDLGPEGGDAGGEIIATGTPETVAACPASITGQLLKKRL
jgi:excinuclease UvrABC ATPase subunit